MADLSKNAFCFGNNLMWLHQRKHPRLEQLLDTAPSVHLDHSSKIVILSDLHMGNGGRLDEFRVNAELVKTMLERYYRPKKFSLVLNGDIEELLKFPLASIELQWSEFYDLFKKFEHNGFFWKTYGNHDAPLLDEKNYRLASSLVESLKFKYGEETLLLFHGHQASVFMWETFPVVSRAAIFFLRYIAKPAGIRNFSVAHNSHRRFAVEKSIYEFSNQQKIVSIIGHTHRPLFESLSKVDFLNYKIEDLCRLYPVAEGEHRAAIKEQMEVMKIELAACYKQGKKIGLRSGLYHNLTIPSLFNSGCTIGKRGITALEIEGNTIRLVGWYNGKQRPHFESDMGNRPMELSSTGFSRIVLNEDSLDYIFSRLHLLA
jgi:UDP-2,3-diacylglucosamine pyrophosphatase LpxH